MPIPGVYARFRAAKACFHRAQYGGMSGSTDTAKIIDALDNIGRGLESLAKALEQQSPIAQAEARRARELFPARKRGR